MPITSRSAHRTSRFYLEDLIKDRGRGSKVKDLAGIVLWFYHLSVPYVSSPNTPGGCSSTGLGFKRSEGKLNRSTIRNFCTENKD